jgi:FdhD protein
MAKSESYSKVSVSKVYREQAVDENDVLAVEEPLEIRIGFSIKGKRRHQAISITMRTPGDDFELATGFLFTEGILQSAEQVEGIKHCGKIGKVGFKNTVRVDLKDDVNVDFKKLERHFYTTSSCGVCGKTSIEALQTGATRIEDDNFVFKSDLIHELPEKLLKNQSVFERTGGLHASALFDKYGTLDIVREDVGRHNALDKIIGAKFLENKTPLNDKLLLLSGRISFELVQKALMAGIPIIVAVGPPSSLAVELAEEFNITLVGFVRNQRFNVYTGKRRII